MTLEALQNAIAKLIITRREAHGNQAEQDRINKKLTKLYDLKYTMLEQQSKNNPKRQFNAALHPHCETTRMFQSLSALGE